MSWPATFTADLFDLIGDVWPSVNVILRSTEMARIPWEQLVTEGINGEGPLAPPFAVAVLGRYGESELSPMDSSVMKATVALFYVDSKPPGAQVEEALEERMNEMATALYQNTREYLFCPARPTFDVTDENRCNRVFVQQGNHPFAGGELLADLLVNV